MSRRMDVSFASLITVQYQNMLRNKYLQPTRANIQINISGHEQSIDYYKG